MEYNRDDIVKRFAQIQEQKSKSVSQFARILGENQVTVNNYILNNREPSLKFAAIVIDKFRDINPFWLLTGEGEMLLNEAEQKNDNAKHTDQPSPDAYVEHLIKENDELRSLNSNLMIKYQELSEKFVNTLLSGNRVG